MCLFCFLSLSNFFNYVKLTVFLFHDLHFQTQFETFSSIVLLSFLICKLVSKKVQLPQCRKKTGEFFPFFQFKNQTSKIICSRFRDSSGRDCVERSGLCGRGGTHRLLLHGIYRGRDHKRTSSSPSRMSLTNRRGRK